MLINVHTVLVGTTHPGNVGAAARALKTMGLLHLHLVAGCALDERASVMAGSADDVLDGVRRHGDLNAALAGVGPVYGLTARGRHRGVPALTPRQAADEIAGMGERQPVALLYGREHSGLTNIEIGHCHRLVHIPANPRYSSLNLAAAVQIMSYELRLSSTTAGDTAVTTGAANGAHLTGLYEHLSRAMAASGYAAPDEQTHLMQRLRRLFNRALPETAEVNILRGILAAMERRMRDTRRE